MSTDLLDKVSDYKKELRRLKRQNTLMNKDITPRVIDFTLNVPSGILVVGNDFRHAFRTIGDYNVNKFSGVEQCTHKYASVGLAHGFVGNSCPGFYRVNDKWFYIGNRGRKNPIEGSRCVGGICTDLWWYSVADGAEFDKRYKIINEEPPDHKKYKCTPGVYRFRHYYNMLTDDQRYGREGAVYANIVKIRKADPVVDYHAEFMALNFTAGQEINDSIRRYPTLYDGPERIDRIQRAADQIFVVNGNGLDWHPNGWLSDNPDLDPKTPSAKIPLFDRQFRWYPLSEWSFLAAAADMSKKTTYPHITLNESFAELAFNIAYSIAKYGNSFEYAMAEPHIQERAAKEQIQLAGKILDKLKTIYPIPKLLQGKI